MRGIDLACASLLAVAPLALAGCAPNTLSISGDIEDATVLVDGRVETQLTARPIGYFGTTVIDAEPAESPRADLVRAQVRHLETIEPPAPEWLFPFDFAADLVQRVFSGPRSSEVRLSVPARPNIVVEAPAPRTLELSTAADRMRTAR